MNDLGVERHDCRPLPGGFEFVGRGCLPKVVVSGQARGEERAPLNLGKPFRSATLSSLPGPPHILSIYTVTPPPAICLRTKRTFTQSDPRWLGKIPHTATVLQGIALLDSQMEHNPAGLLLRALRNRFHVFGPLSESHVGLDVEKASVRRANKGKAA